jgi:hypothetical protein
MSLAEIVLSRTPFNEIESAAPPDPVGGALSPNTYTITDIVSSQLRGDPEEAIPGRRT